MEIQLIRHATHLISYHGYTFLLDPMFSEQGTLAPVPNAPNQDLKNPLAALPVKVDQLLNVDAILVSHTHRDHFDEAAIAILPKDLPLFCQPEDEELIKSKGFHNVITVESEFTWNSIKLIRTTGRHGKGDLADKMGPVSWFVLAADIEPSLYIIGDSVWYSEIESNFKKYAPDVAIVFAGEARFLEGDPITMGISDIENIIKASPKTQLIISHMESWNHCLLTREAVRNFSQKHNYEIIVPENGEKLRF